MSNIYSFGAYMGFSRFMATAIWLVAKNYAAGLGPASALDHSGSQAEGTTLKL